MVAMLTAIGVIHINSFILLSILTMGLCNTESGNAVPVSDSIKVGR